MSTCVHGLGRHVVTAAALFRGAAEAGLTTGKVRCSLRAWIHAGVQNNNRSKCGGADATRNRQSGNKLTLAALQWLGLKWIEAGKGNMGLN
eukprot:6197238-Pleurochrysis_carterae.AAC.3